MLRLSLCLSLAFLVGCNSTESKNEPVVITAGTYEATYNGTQGVGRVQLNLKNDGTFTGKAYVKLYDGSMDCQISDEFGKWVFAEKFLKLSETVHRTRENCADPFSNWSGEPDSDEDVRNITASIFEMYSEGDDEDPAAWIKFKKI